VDVDKSEMRGKGLTDRDIQLSQSAPCPSVYGEKMANVEDVRLNVVNQRRWTWRPQHRWRRRIVCGSDTVGASQWGAAARERRYSSPQSLGIATRTRRAVGQRGCRGRKAKQLSKHRGGVAVHDCIRETFPALVDRYK